eukprot:UN04538
MSQKKSFDRWYTRKSTVNLMRSSTEDDFYEEEIDYESDPEYNLDEEMDKRLTIEKTLTEDKEPETWTAEEVGDYIGQLSSQLKVHRESIVANGIDGTIMADILTDRDSIKELGVENTEHQEKIILSVQSLMHETNIRRNDR